MNDYTNIIEFKDWWLKSGRPLLPPFKNSVHLTDMAYAVCLYRKEQFQIELYICKPNTETPPHFHPDIHSISMYLTGDLQFAKEDGTWTDLSQFQKPGKAGTHMLLGQTAEVNYGTQHTLRVGSVGGSFILFEHWLQAAPTSVAIEYGGGVPIGPIHAETIRNGHVV